jgi:hypothetical protein
MPVPEMRDHRSPSSRGALFSDELPELRDQDGPKIKKINRRERGERRAELQCKDSKENGAFLNFVF